MKVQISIMNQKDFGRVQTFRIMALEDAEINGVQIHYGDLGGYVSKNTKLNNTWLSRDVVAINSNISDSIITGNSFIINSVIKESTIAGSKLSQCDLLRSEINGVDLSMCTIKWGSAYKNKK